MTKTSFDAQELEKMAGKEFHLMVYSERTFDIIDRMIEKQKGKKPEQKQQPEGSLAEIISRQPHNIREYRLGELAKVTYENGNPVNKDVRDIYQSYIFKLAKTEFPTGKPPILTGKAGRYDLHDNSSEPLTTPMILYFEKTPTEKESEGLACL